MELERCYSVLAVSSSLKFNESIRGLLPESRYFPVTVMRDAAGARRELLEQSYDLVIINAPLTDEFGTRLALDVCDRSGAGVLLTAYLVSLQKFDLLTPLSLTVFLLLWTLPVLLLSDWTGRY